MLDRQRMNAWLATRTRCGPRARIWVEQYLRDDGWGEGASALDDDECAGILYAALAQCVDPVVRAGRVDALVRLAESLGYGEAGLDEVVLRQLRITVRRLRAHGVLLLPLGCTMDEVKAAHRARVKLVHPDRLGHVSPEERREAERSLMEINEARALLAQPYEDVDLTGADDVVLEGWSEGVSEDAPTELWGGDAPTEAPTETWGADPSTGEAWADGPTADLG